MYVDEQYKATVLPNLFYKTWLVPGVTYQDVMVDGAGGCYWHKLTSTAASVGTPGRDFTDTAAADTLVQAVFNNNLQASKKIYGVQAAGAPSMEHAFHDHKYETLDSAVTFADGIAVKTPGETTFDMVSQYVDEIVTVSEDEIAAAILALMENQKLVAEGAGATPVAAALFGKLPLAGKKTVCLISGGNIDVNILSRVITRGLVMSGRKTNLMIALEDKPGQLSLVSDIVSACGANVVSVHHDRSDANMAITSCFLKLGLETRDAAQIETIKQKLTEAGFKLVTERA